MNIKQSIELSKLRQRKTLAVEPRTMSAERLTNEVFRLSAAAGMTIEMKKSEWRKRHLISDEFVLTEIEVGKAAMATPVKKQSVKLLASAAELPPVVVDLNKNSVGKTYGGYIPPVVIVAGGESQQAAIQQGRERIKAWVGVKAMKKIMGSGRLISADHDLGAGELRSLLQKKLDEQKKPAVSKAINTPCCGEGPTGWIEEVYPTENYFIYNAGGKKMKQRYKVDTANRSVEFDGSAEEVRMAFVPVKPGLSRLETAATLSRPIARQDTPHNNSAPHEPLPKMVQDRGIMSDGVIIDKMNVKKSCGK